MYMLIEKYNTIYFWDYNSDRDILKLYNVRGDIGIYITDFTFEHNGKTYKIGFPQKGNLSGPHILTIGGKNYVADNLWINQKNKLLIINCTVKKIKESTVPNPIFRKINPRDFELDDIVLDK